MKKKLIERIENLRREMYDLVQEKGIKSDEVIRKSQELDRLLNLYFKLIERNKNDKN